jgi:hypothetical protein
MHLPLAPQAFSGTAEDFSAAPFEISAVRDYSGPAMGVAMLVRRGGVLG